MLEINPCIACRNCVYDPQSDWCVCEKRGGLTPQRRCDDFELDTIDPEFQTEMLSATTDLEDLEPGEYSPLIEDPILTPDQMSIYYMGYVNGMKWMFKRL